MTTGPEPGLPDETSRTVTRRLRREEEEAETTPPPMHPFDKSNGWASTAERILTICMVAVVLLIVVIVAFGSMKANSLNDKISTTRDVILTNRQNGYVNRSISCRLLLTLGQALDRNGPCYDPEVLAYYDPKGVVQKTGNTEAICTILILLKSPVSRLPDNCFPLHDYPKVGR